MKIKNFNKQLSESKDGGISFTSLLLIAFIVLKLTNTITWSWFWVLSPVWAPIVIALLLLGLAALLDDKKDNEKGEEIIIKSKWQERIDAMKEKQKQN